MRIRNLLIFTVVALAVALLVNSRPIPAAAAGPLRIAVIMPSSTTDMAFSQSMFDALKTVQKQMGGESAMTIAYTDNMFRPPTPRPPSAITPAAVTTSLLPIARCTNPR